MISIGSGRGIMMWWSSTLLFHFGSDVDAFAKIAGKVVVKAEGDY